MQKISFSVENANLVKENPDSNFAVLSLDFFASGENLHDMYVSQETLMKTADSIKNCPLVWKYDETLDDAHTHDKDEVPCGFVPESSSIEARVLDDGRTMLSVMAYVWKRYTGELLGFFKRDGGKKPVSVEMSVYDTQTLNNGLEEILDFRYEGITILGSFITPAIPNARAMVLSFSEIEKDYKKAVQREFSDTMIIPEEVKENAKKGLQLRKQFSKGGSSVSLAFAKYLVDTPHITTEKAEQILEYFAVHKKDNTYQTNPPTRDYISSLLWGGLDANVWAKNLLEEINNTEEFMKKTEEELAAEAKVAEDVKMALEAEEAKIAEDVKMALEAEEAKIAEDVKMAKEADEAKKAEEDKKAGEDKKFEFPSNFSFDVMSALFSDDEEEDVKMAKEEIKKGEFCNPGIMMGAMFSKMCRMAEAITKMAETEKVYMAENEELKKFKAQLEDSQKSFAIESMMKELSEKVVLPTEARDEMLAEAEKYSFATIEEWKTYCKAKALDFAVKEHDKTDDVVRVGMAWGTSTRKSDDLWASQ